MYKQLNKRALEDADLYFRTGRVKTLSPPPSSKSDEEVTEVQLVRSEVQHQTTKRKSPIHGGSGKQQVELPSSKIIVLVSSDSDVEYCRGKEKKAQFHKDSLPTTTIGDDSDDTDSDFYANDNESDTESSFTASAEEYLQSEEDFDLTTTLNHYQGTASTVLRRKRRTSAKAILNTEGEGNLQEVSSCQTKIAKT